MILYSRWSYVTESIHSHLLSSESGSISSQLVLCRALKIDSKIIVTAFLERIFKTYKVGEMIAAGTCLRDEHIDKEYSPRDPGAHIQSEMSH